MKRIPSSWFWLAIVLTSTALVVGSFTMVAWLKLQPARYALPSARCPC